MEGKEGRSSDESGTEKNPRDDTKEQKNLLEEEIKKIISDLDIKFDDSPEEDTERTATAGPSSIPTVQAFPSDRREKAETQHVRVETASTVSNATTVVQQRVPSKISVTHVKSPRDTFHRNNRLPQTPGEMYHGSNRLPESPRQEGIPMDINRYYGVAEQGFYQPERDEITDPTTSDTVHTTTENTTTSYAQGPAHQQPRAAQYCCLPSLPEERSRDFRDFREAGIAVQQYQQRQPQQRPYEMLPNNDYNAPVLQYSHAGQPPVEPTRYPGPPNYAPVDPRDHQYHPQYYQDVGPHPPQNQEPYQMKENVNRYNSNHRTYSTVKEPERPSKQSLTDYLLTKSRSFFGRRDDSDSGEVIPQLYKACVKNGTSPPRFTFKAVTGVQPYAAPYQSHPANQHNPPVVHHNDCPPAHGAQPCYEPAVNPCCCPQELQKTHNNCCEKNCEIITMPGKSGIKTKAYYSDLGCGYISEATVPEKVDIYCFDQLNTGFFRTSDHPPPLFADLAVQRTEKYANVFWAEVYGVANVGTAFTIALFLQTIKFALQGVVRPLMIGTVQLFSDYFIKPLLTLLYNGFTQPISIFIYNVVASIRDILQPIAKGLGYFAEVIAVILRSIRLVEVKNVTNITPCSPPHPVKYIC